jgi:TolB-like protein/tetratricopeptide (TPR) repeat protein
MSSSAGFPVHEKGQDEDLRAYLGRLLSESTFAASTRRGRLLRYLVEESLAGKGEEITEYAIGLDVLGKPSSFDTRVDSSVRAEVSRLRRALTSYYEQEGSGDPWRIAIAQRGYQAMFEPVAEPTAAKKRPSTRWKWVGSVAIAMVITTAIVFWRARFDPPEIRSVVVLPLENLTGDPAQEYIGDGVTEELTDSLARIPDLRVVARTSAFQFKGKGVDVRQVGRQLNVEAVVEGSIRESDGRLRLTAQVNRTRDGFHILSHTIEGSEQELGRLERELADSVQLVLRPRAKIPARHIPAREAREFLLKAKVIGGKGTVEAFRSAIEWLNRAIESDPSYADAYAALSGTYVSGMLNFASEPLNYVPPAKAAAARALELDPNCARAYASQGYLDSMILMDWSRGEDELRHALQLMPQEATHHNWLGLTLLVQGRFDESLHELRTAENLDPLSPAAGATVGFALYCARRYDEALRQFNKVLDLHPDAALPIAAHVGAIYEAKGDFATAMAKYNQVLEKAPAVKERIAHLLASTGRRDEARRILREIEIPTANGPPDPFAVAIIYGALGDRDRAFEWLDRAYAARKIALLKVDPMLDPLRLDPRFQALLKKTGFSR